MGRFHVKTGHLSKLAQEKSEKSGTFRKKRDGWHVCELLNFETLDTNTHPHLENNQPVPLYVTIRHHI